LSHRVRYTAPALADLERLYEFLVAQEVDAAERALDTIRKATQLLETFPFTCRKLENDSPFMREFIISFGSSGYVALFEIEDENTVTILALRHQREDDYY
jgi:plasmid stabilization system protein ParE